MLMIEHTDLCDPNVMSDSTRIKHIMILLYSNLI